MNLMNLEIIILINIIWKIFQSKSYPNGLTHKEVLARNARFSVLLWKAGKMPSLPTSFVYFIFSQTTVNIKIEQLEKKS